MRERIVQAEFLHVGRHEDGTRSVCSFFKELEDRIEDGAPIKTVVRFPDDGSFDRLIAKGKTLSYKRLALHNEFPHSKGVRRWYLDRMSRRWAGQSLALMEKITKKAVEKLASCPTALIKVRVVGIEFRPLRQNERHELIESVKSATGVWLFLYDTHSVPDKLVNSYM